MRISDWSSDVCSSDLEVFIRMGMSKAGEVMPDGKKLEQDNVWSSVRCPALSDDPLRGYYGQGMEDRKSVVLGKSVSVRVDLGGRRIINKKKPLSHSSLPSRPHDHNPTKLCSIA